MKKSQITTQTFFYILMAFLMIGIIVYGYSKINTVSEIISEQERIEITNKLKETFEYCNDPLNKGSVKNVEIISNKFNGICYFKENENNFQNEEIKKIFESNHNTILINNNSGYLQIIDSFYSKSNFDKSKCSFEKLNGKINLEIIC